MRTLGLLLFSGLVLAPTAGFAKVVKGERAAEFTLPDRNGRPVKLSDLRGSIVVIDFWAAWCEPCKKELPELEVLARKYAAANKKVVFLAINYDETRKKADAFLATIKIDTMQVLYDTSKRVVGTYDPSLPLPPVYVVDAKGIVQMIQNGYEPGAKTIQETIDRLLAK